MTQRAHPIVRALRVRIDPDVHPEVRRSCLEFARWLRREYYFPVRVPIYVRNIDRLKCRDGDWAYGTFFGPDDLTQEPYIRIAVGGYEDLEQAWGQESALTAILKTISHELTHYFQWVNQLDLTDIGRERQATIYSRFILDEYAEIRERP